VRAAPFSGVNELIGDYRNSFAMSPAKDLAREGKVHFSSLYVSGGGDYGAFGAGLLYGWSEADDRPEFKVVTGVSTGALTAPLAFIGNSRDEELKQIFTDIKPDDIFVPSLLSGIFGGEALADTAPLRSIISQVADADLIDDVAREHRKGRRLL
jgi:predicted acylesterase/phospholipase RssA